MQSITRVSAGLSEYTTRWTSVDPHFRVQTRYCLGIHVAQEQQVGNVHSCVDERL